MFKKILMLITLWGSVGCGTGLEVKDGKYVVDVALIRDTCRPYISCFGRLHMTWEIKGTKIKVPDGTFNIKEYDGAYNFAWTYRVPQSNGCAFNNAVSAGYEPKPNDHLGIVVLQRYEYPQCGGYAHFVCECEYDGAGVKQ